MMAASECLGSSFFFEIHEIRVKQSDKNSFSAKQNALLKAAKLAFLKLAKKKLNLDAQIVEKVPNNKIQECIYDYSIENEKYSDSFYIAELSYRFSREKISLLLKDYGVILEVPENSTPEEITIVLRTSDFLQSEIKLRELEPLVKSFSSDRVIFNMDRKNMDAFRALRIRYAQLQ
jgi:hypothetical protein